MNTRRTAYVRTAACHPRLPALLLALLFYTLCTLSAAPVQAQDAVGDLLGRINALRSSLGLPGYSLNGALNAAAQSHAQWMASTGTISHTGPGGSTPTSRALAAGYPSSFVSENIYAGSIAGVNDAWIFWINSPIHYRGLTNPGYTEIGIGVASTDWGNAFVLDFGSQSNPYIGSSGGGGGNSTTGGGGNNSAPQAPPSFIVGYDAVGNIMHEIQEEQTLGDIALIYGYTWADIPHLLEINGLTEADVRTLQVGGVFLVPPHSGTYTPSPLPPGVTLTASPEPPTGTPGGATLTPTVDMTLIVGMLQTQKAPTPTPETDTSVVQPRIGTAVSAPDLPSDLPVNLPTVGISADGSPTPTTTLQTSADPALSTATPAAPPVAVAQLSTPGTGQITLVRDDSSKPLIMIAIVVQSLVILAAGYEFVRRLRQR